MAADPPCGPSRDLESALREQGALVASRCGERAARWLLVHVADQAYVHLRLSGKCHLTYL